MAKRLENDKEVASWDALLTPSKDKRPFVPPEPPAAPAKNAPFSIDESEYALDAAAARRKLSVIAEDVNEHSRFTLGKQKWCINEYSRNNAVVKDIMVEHLARKYGIRLTADEVLCFILHWRENAEAICFTEKSTRSYATADKAALSGPADGNTAAFYRQGGPELIIYTEAGEKYNVKMPAWERERFYRTLKITDGETPAALESKSEDEATDKKAEAEALEAEAEALEAEAEAEEARKAEAEALEAEAARAAEAVLEAAAEAVLEAEAQARAAEEARAAEAALEAEALEAGYIISGYCHSIYLCLELYFNRRHISADGSVRHVEVSVDKYDAVFTSLQDAIAKGAVAGVSDPADAKTLIGKGLYTYKQVKHIARVNPARGVIEGLSFDEEQERVIHDYPYGTTAAISYALSLWAGGDPADALRSAAYDGMRTHGVLFATAILSSRLAPRETDMLTAQIGAKAAEVLVSMYKGGINISGGTPRAQVSAADTAGDFKSRILNHTASQLPQPKAPEPPGFWGRLRGVFPLKSKKPDAAIHEVLRHINEDALDLMLKFITRAYIQLCEDYLLNETENDRVMDKLCGMLTGRVLRDIYLDENRLMVIDEMVRPIIREVLRERETITPPRREQLRQGLILALEEIADEQLNILLR